MSMTMSSSATETMASTSQRRGSADWDFGRCPETGFWVCVVNAIKHLFAPGLVGQGFLLDENHSFHQ